MSLLKYLQGLGDRLGILETASTPGTKQLKRIQTRTVTLKELASEINSKEVRALADSPAELGIPFEKIYEKAGVSSREGDWTIDKLRLLIASDPLKDKSREEIQKAVLDRLSSEGVDVGKIVKDAIARDQALDSFERFVGEKMQDRIKCCKNNLQEIEAQIRKLQEEGSDLEQKIRIDEHGWRDWRIRKRAFEREMALAIGYIIDRPVVSIDEEDAK